MIVCTELNIILLVFNVLTSAGGVTSNLGDSIYEPGETYYKIDEPTEAYKVKTEVTIVTNGESKPLVLVCRSGVCNKNRENTDTTDDIKADIIVHIQTRANISSSERRPETPLVIGARGLHPDPNRAVYPSVTPNYSTNINRGIYPPVTPNYNTNINRGVYPLPDYSTNPNIGVFPPLTPSYNMDINRSVYPPKTPNYNINNFGVNPPNGQPIFYGRTMNGLSHFDSSRRIYTASDQNLANVFTSYPTDGQQVPNMYGSSITEHTSTNLGRELEPDQRVLPLPLPSVNRMYTPSVICQGQDNSPGGQSTYSGYPVSVSHRLEPPITYPSRNNGFPPLGPRQLQNRDYFPIGGRQTPIEHRTGFVPSVPPELQSAFGGNVDAASTNVITSQRKYDTNNYNYRHRNAMEVHRIPVLNPSYQDHQSRENSGPQDIIYPRKVSTYNPKEFKDIPEPMPLKPSAWQAAFDRYLQTDQSFNKTEQLKKTEDCNCNTTQTTVS